MPSNKKKTEYQVFCHIDNHPYPIALPVVSAGSVLQAEDLAREAAATMGLPVHALTYEVWRLKRI